jgi:hypothetical protein
MWAVRAIDKLAGKRLVKGKVLSKPFRASNQSLKSCPGLPDHVTNENTDRKKRPVRAIQKSRVRLTMSISKPKTTNCGRILVIKIKESGEHHRGPLDRNKTNNKIPGIANPMLFPRSNTMNTGRHAIPKTAVVNPNGIVFFRRFASHIAGVIELRNSKNKYKKSDPLMPRAKFSSQ